MSFVFDQPTIHRVRVPKRRKLNSPQVRKQMKFLPFLQSQRNEIVRNTADIKSAERKIASLRASMKSLRCYTDEVNDQKRLIRSRIKICTRALQAIKFKHVSQFDTRIVPLLNEYHQQSSQGNIRHHELIDTYKTEFNTAFEAPKLIPTNTDVCGACSGMLLRVSDESRLVCPDCGITQQFMDTSASTIAFGDEIEYTTFSYKRINHLKEKLNHFQAKESTSVSQDIIDNIMNYLYEQRITDVGAIEFEQIRKAQKELGVGKYAQTMQIWSRITGNPPVRLDPICEEKIHLMFRRIQKPWDKHCPKGRKNFLSYPYCILKFLQMLGYSSFLHYFSLLKCPDKLQVQEEIFKKICKEIGWTFIPINSTKNGS